MCNVVYKIVNMVLANRLKTLLIDVINMFFIPMRLIIFNVMIICALIHNTKMKTKEKKGDVSL